MKYDFMHTIYIGFLNSWFDVSKPYLKPALHDWYTWYKFYPCNLLKVEWECSRGPSGKYNQ